MEKAKFYKVSYQQFEEGYLDCQPQANQAEIQAAYDALKLPKRATKGSAGYDFYKIGRASCRERVSSPV